MSCGHSGLWLNIHQYQGLQGDLLLARLVGEHRLCRWSQGCWGKRQPGGQEHYTLVNRNQFPMFVSLFSLQFQLGMEECSGQCTRWSPSQHQKFSQLRLFRRTTANKLSIRVKVNQKFTFFELLSLWTLLKWFWWGCHRGHNCVNLLIDFNQAAISRVNLVAVSKWGPPSNTKVKCNMDWMNNEQPLWNSQIFLLPSEEKVKTYSPPGPSEGSSWRS